MSWLGKLLGTNPPPNVKTASQLAREQILRDNPNLLEALKGNELALDALPDDTPCHIYVAGKVCHTIGEYKATPNPGQWDF